MNSGGVFRWATLLVLSALLAGALERARMPAALLLGPMAASILLAGTGTSLRVPQVLFLGAQGVVGCLVAALLPLSLFGEIGRAWPEFLFGLLAVILAAAALGALLARGGVLPGTTAIWGTMPGAATVMTLMSDGFGADMRLVAFMQYLRVVCVALVASTVARLVASGSHVPVAPRWFGHMALAPSAATAVLAAGGAFVGGRSGIPGGPLLLPMLAGMGLKEAGVVSMTLPMPLLAASYALIGWSIGMRFTAPVLRETAHAFPRVLVSIMALIACCGAFGWLLHLAAGIDLLSACLATSPGGADSVAIIAASTPVNVPFVMAMQVGRFLLVLLIGPWLARLVAGAMSGARVSGGARWSRPGRPPE